PCLSSSSAVTLRVRPSFPTRRSSDLRQSPIILGGAPARLTTTDCFMSLFPFVIAIYLGASASLVLASVSPRHWLTQAGLLLAFRSEEHTSELQSRFDLVCRLLLEKKT